MGELALRLSAISLFCLMVLLAILLYEASDKGRAVKTKLSELMALYQKVLEFLTGNRNRPWA